VVLTCSGAEVLVLKCWWRWRRLIVLMVRVLNW